MNAKAKRTRSGLALDDLGPWFRGSPQPCAAAVNVVGSNILQFGLPPLGDHKTPKEFAAFLLKAGAEIEHSLLIQYLYAAYSVDERSADDSTNEALQWKTVIRLVAREEMTHLITVQNLLLSLGNDFHLSLPPLHRAEVELGLPFKLERLSLKSLRKYIILESPSDDQIHSDDDRALVADIRRKLGAGVRILRVGSIYAALYWLFSESDRPGSNWPFSASVVPCFLKEYPKDFHLRDSDFIDQSAYQERAALPGEWGVYESNAHVDGASPRETALASLRWIMAQGEGPNAIEESHFYRFLKIFQAMQRLDPISRRFVMKAPVNPFVSLGKPSGQGNNHGTPIVNSKSRDWAELLNVRYRLMLLNIMNALNLSHASASEERKRAAQSAVLEMEFVKKIGQALPYMFLTDKTSTERAGAPFQATKLPIDNPSRLRLRKQLLEGSGRLIASLKKNDLTNSDDAPTAASEISTLDTIARRDDEMRARDF